MTLKAGLVGLPNVGKSTLFNALTLAQVPAENFPFCTIDPHEAVTPVFDQRAINLQKVYNSKEIIPATVTFIDIAGLVKGAAEGAGLGNRFLGHIREADLIIHVLRCFEDTTITRSEAVDPLMDFEIIMGELMLKDIDTIDKRLEKLVQLTKASKNKPQELVEYAQEKELLEKIKLLIDKGDYHKAAQVQQEKPQFGRELLCIKPNLIVANIAEDEVDGSYTNNKHYQSLVKHFGQKKVIAVCAKLEGDIARASENEKQEIIELFNIKELGLTKIISQTYVTLGYATFFTCGPQEIHCWRIPKNINVRKAAGEIHSDLEKGFICAEVFNYQDLENFKTVNGVKEAGKIRREGADYVMQDGDIVLVRFNV
jgi:GTP-binding protein YchF